MLRCTATERDAKASMRPCEPDEASRDDDADGPAASTDRLLITVTEAADRLSISRSKAYELIGSGVLPTVKLGARRLVPVESLNARVAMWGRSGSAV